MKEQKTFADYLWDVRGLDIDSEHVKNNYDLLFGQYCDSEYYNGKKGQ